MQGSVSTDELKNIERQRRNFCEHVDEASEVVKELLFVGGNELIKDKNIQRLRRIGIGRILCCYENSNNVGTVEQQRGFKRMSLPLMDCSEEDVLCVLYDAFDFILLDAKRSSCLVHCQTGCSRSVAISIAYLMWSEGLTYDEAFRRVKQVRSVERLKFSFCKQLEEWG